MAPPLSLADSSSPYYLLIKISKLAEQFGSQCTVVAIDAVQTAEGSGKWEVVIHSGKEKTGLDVIDWAVECVKRGAGEILLTSFDRDGTKSGRQTNLLLKLWKF